MIAESAKRRSPEIFDRGLAVGKNAAVIREKRQVPSWMKGNSDQLGQIDGVDVLVSGVKTEEKAGGGTLERVSSVIGIGEIVACQRDDDLSASGRQDPLA